MRYKGATSSRRTLPGSSPQGAFLGILLFIIIFNGALLRPSIPRPNSLHLKYIDDLSVLQAYDLRELIKDPIRRPFPLQRNERFEYILPENNGLLEDLDTLYEFTNAKQLIIKEKKTHLMKFNFSNSHDFPPEIKIKGFSENIGVVSKTKLLGVIISKDLKWNANTEYICNKAYKKLWIIRRLKALNLEPSFLLDVYVKEVRSILELAVPAWHGSLTDKLSRELERVQKVAVRIIIGKHVSYTAALKRLNLDSLYDRREKLCRKFAEKTLKSRHSDIFVRNNTLHETRFKQKFKHPFCNTGRYFNSPVNFLTRLLNED